MAQELVCSRFRAVGWGAGDWCVVGYVLSSCVVGLCVCRSRVNVCCVSRYCVVGSVGLGGVQTLGVNSNQIGSD